MPIDPLTAATVGSTLVALAGWIYTHRKYIDIADHLDAVLKPISSFSYLAAKYTAAKSDGTFDAVDKENLAIATIKFFDDLDAAGVEITRP